MKITEYKKFTPFILMSVIFLMFLFPLPVKALTVSPPRLELEGDPGTIINGKIKLLNEQENKTFYSSFENFEARGEDGTPSFVQSTEDLAGWINTQEEVNLKNGEEVSIPFTINIPKNAEPGGHFAGIFWGTAPPKNATVSISAKIPTLILLRVSGAVKEGGGILEYSTVNNQKFFTSLPVDFFYRFQNNGADRAKPKGEIKVKNMLGFTSSKLNVNPTDGNILPNSTRRFNVIWGDQSGKNLYPNEMDDNFLVKFVNGVKREWHNFAFGRYNAKLNFVYGSQNTPVNASFVLWVFPWHLTLVVIVLIIVIILLGRREVLKYNEWVVRNAMKHLKNAHQTIKKAVGVGNRPRI